MLDMANPRLQLDYHALPQYHWAPGLFLLALGFAAAAALTLDYLSIQEDIAARENRLDALHAAHTRHSAAPAAIRLSAVQTAAELTAANNVAENLSLPWTALFGALEKAADSRIALIAIEPNAKTRIVRISGETDKLEHVLPYLQTLQKQAELMNVSLAEHEIVLRGPGQPVRFTITASWRSAP